MCVMLFLLRKCIAAPLVLLARRPGAESQSCAVHTRSHTPRPHVHSPTLTPAGPALTYERGLSTRPHALYPPLLTRTRPTHSRPPCCPSAGPGLTRDRVLSTRPHTHARMPCNPHALHPHPPAGPGLTRDRVLSNADQAVQHAHTAGTRTRPIHSWPPCCPPAGPGLTRERVLTKLTKLFKQSTAPLVVVAYCGPSDERGNWLLAGQVGAGGGGGVAGAGRGGKGGGQWAVQLSDG